MHFHTGKDPEKEEIQLHNAPKDKKVYIPTTTYQTKTALVNRMVYSRSL